MRSSCRETNGSRMDEKSPKAVCTRLSVHSVPKSRLQEKVPAYVVFSNATLQDMCARQPITEGELLEVSGVAAPKQTNMAMHFLPASKNMCGKPQDRNPLPQVRQPHSASVRRIRTAQAVDRRRGRLAAC